MARMFGFQETVYGALADWLRTALPQVPTKPNVMQALADHSQLSPDDVVRVVTAGTDPLLFVEDLPEADGWFSPAQPQMISLAKRRALELQASPTDGALRQHIEAIVLHEMVHWSWARAGRQEQENGVDVEAGELFERAAYNSGAVRETARVVATASGDENLGALSRQYESNGKPGAIGRDNVGGWSYGLYQLSSRMGILKDFLDFLHREAGRHAEYAAFEQSLLTAGGDTEARRGGLAFHAAWRQLAGDPAFASAQDEYIKQSHYTPFVGALTQQGIDVSVHSKVLRAVAWSVSVQHGPSATVIFTRPWETLTASARTDDALVINAVYHERSRVDVYFKNSTKDVQSAVLRRFENERVTALQMLQSV